MTLLAVFLGWVVFMVLVLVFGKTNPGYEHFEKVQAAYEARKGRLGE